jgi:hypothetical protein
LKEKVYPNDELLFEIKISFEIIIGLMGFYFKRKMLSNW